MRRDAGSRCIAAAADEVGGGMTEVYSASEVTSELKFRSEAALICSLCCSFPGLKVACKVPWC